MNRWAYNTELIKSDILKIPKNMEWIYIQDCCGLIDISNAHKLIAIIMTIDPNENQNNQFKPEQIINCKQKYTVPILTVNILNRCTAYKLDEYKQELVKMKFNKDITDKNGDGDNTLNEFIKPFIGSLGYSLMKNIPKYEQQEIINKLKIYKNWWNFGVATWLKDRFVFS